ncbi:MAG TPA: glutamine synthetase type III [Lentisphaeria bacterium]|nr:glutamine synthetase type III [Lentisphaeria bacterium]
MSKEQRVSAISSIARKAASASETAKSVSEIYGEDVFSLKAMKDYLAKPVYKSLLLTIQKGETLKTDIADEVANAMKRWAISKGATHYTHWFQPLTGTTAEKHDSFIVPDDEGGVIMEFSGDSLAKGEPDASSFPSGGLRATFEARGYTAWDPTSPAFIKRSNKDAFLCIPTAFYSYTGEALDKKIPLLRSMKAVGEQAKRLLSCFGIDVEGRVITTLGAEQEYFLIDKEFYYARPDLLHCGRSLFGALPAKHQQLEDHYFGSIKKRILNFMVDVDRELWKLGIPAKTRHNEVAPSQFEIASQFEECNLAVDHNMQIMEVLKEIANKQGLICLLHEKPFAGINGSGKHNNWSIAVDGLNLLNPGKDPINNAIFITTLCAIIKAVDTHADILRATVARAGNDHRLGANEAPPAIISIFLGDQLTDVIEQLEQGGSKSARGAETIKIGVDTLPEFPKDLTDRNRTSPFAFTGNKFEFRAVGSSQNCAGPNTTLNTIVAEAFDEIATELEKVKGDQAKVNSKLQGILKEIIKKHKRILFNGDNYTQSWQREAEKRGLPNLRNTPEALEAIVTTKAEKLFSKYKVLSKTELHSRYDVFKEEYAKTILIEGNLVYDIAKTMVQPAAIRYQNILLKNMSSQKSNSISSGLKTITKKITEVGAALDELEENLTVLKTNISKHNLPKIIECMTSARHNVDLLETLVDDAMWPMPKYSEMLFIS